MLIARLICTPIKWFWKDRTAAERRKPTLINFLWSIYLISITVSHTCLNTAHFRFYTLMLKIYFFWSILIYVNLRWYQLDRTDVSAIHQLKIADIWQYFSIIFRKNQAKEWTSFYRFRTCTLSELPLPLVSWLCEYDSSTATKISNKDDIKTIGIRDNLCIKPRRCLPWQHNAISKPQTP